MENADEMKAFIESGKAVMGIELGSTRIKAVVIDDRFRVVAQGAHDWENSLVDGVWSYSLDDVGEGVRDAFAKCAADVEAKCGAKLERLAALGVSGMMHGYLPFDGEGRLLVPFRTWRNVMTADAAAELTNLFKFNIPQRWSIAHYYQAILRGESHVGAVRRLTTLAGYVHKCLSGERVLGVGEASGMFPVDPATCDYNAGMLAAFDAKAGVSLKGMLPRVLKAGEGAGVLTEEGAKWLDPTGTLKPGALMAPPEGDAGTGMVATNAVAPGTGNVSAGTSVFAMVVLDEGVLSRDRRRDDADWARGRDGPLQQLHERDQRMGPADGGGGRGARWRKPVRQALRGVSQGRRGLRRGGHRAVPLRRAGGGSPGRDAARRQAPGQRVHAREFLPRADILRVRLPQDRDGDSAARRRDYEVACRARRYVQDKGRGTEVSR